MTRENEFGQPVGEPVDWAPRAEVGPVTLRGRTCRIEPLEERHFGPLYDALVTRSPASIWTYIAVGPFEDRAPLFAWFRALIDDPAAVPHAIVLPDGRPAGVASYLRLDGRNGSVEIGAIVYAAELQRTTAATEAMYLMMRHPLAELGYRRYEWKCDSLNAPSRRAAERLGFRYEGRFRHALVYKGRNRDTDWLSITDADWPEVDVRLRTWLDASNFDAAGTQIRPLGSLGG